MRCQKCRDDVEEWPSKWTNENDLQPTNSGKHAHSALERERPLTFRTTENKLNLNIESIRSTTYTDLDKRRVCAGKLWIKICVMRKIQTDGGLYKYYE